MAASARLSGSMEPWKLRSLTRRAALATFGAFGALALGCERGASPPPLASELAPLLPPADLSARLAEVKAGRIVVLHVGPKALFDRERIPGARWVAETGTSEGLAAFEAAVKAVPADVEVVAYCGCCPVANCPNVIPARKVLHGRPNGKVLDLPANFRTDWAKKGYAIETKA